MAEVDDVMTDSGTMADADGACEMTPMAFGGHGFVVEGGYLRYPRTWAPHSGLVRVVSGKTMFRIETHDRGFGRVLGLSMGKKSVWTSVPLMQYLINLRDAAVDIVMMRAESADDPLADIKPTACKKNKV